MGFGSETKAELRRTNQSIPIQALINESSRTHSMFVEHRHLYRSLVFGLYIALFGSIPLLRRIHIIETLSILDRIVLFVLGSGLIIWILWSIETKPTIAAKFNGTICENEILTNKPQELMAKVIGVFGEKVLLSFDEQFDDFIEFFRFKKMSFGGWEPGKINYLAIDFRFVIEYYDPSVLYLHALSTKNTAIRMLSRQGFILQSSPNLMMDWTYLKKGFLNVYVCFKKRGFIKKVVIINCPEEEVEERFTRYVKNDSKFVE